MLNFTAIAEGIREAQEENGLKSVSEIRFPEGYVEYGKKLAAINTLDPIEMMTPLNAKTQRILWKNGSNIFPEFEYDDNVLMMARAQAQTIKALGMLESKDDETEGFRIMRQILLDRYNVALAKTELAEGILDCDAHKARHAVAKLYGKLDPDIIEMAENHAQNLAKRKGKIKNGLPAELGADDVERLKNMKFDASGIRKWFKWALERYGINFETIIDDSVSAVTVYPGRVLIPAERKVDGIKLLMLLSHEIECHARDMANGMKLFGEIGGGVLRASDSIMAEGHAKLEDLRFQRKYLGEAREYPEPWYVLAIERASNGVGFNRVANELDFYLSETEPEADVKKDVWKYAYRVYRGSQDTEPARGHRNVFVCTKDKCYFEGYLFAKALVDNGLEHWLEIGMFRPDELLDIASVVKITPDDIPIKKLNLVDELIEKLLN